MIKPQSHVLADTMVIIESHRTGCWKALVNHYKMDTVDKCVEECETGNQRYRNPVPVDTQAIMRDLNPKKISDRELFNLILKCPDAVYLDEGEKHLLAYAMTLSDTYYVCSPDKNCMRVGFLLGIIDFFVSLEDLVNVIGGTQLPLKGNFTNKWLEQFRTQLKLEYL